jgi:RNA-dependent RNA polymerase
LQGRGVGIDAFLALQEEAIADARMIDDSLEQFHRILRCHSLGNTFGLHRIVRRLNDLLTNENDAAIMSDPFFARLRNVAMNHVLRDIKHRARIPVPNSYQLVGVADEGPAYRKQGLENVLILENGQIYGRCLITHFESVLNGLNCSACVQKFDDPEPTYLRGICMISRNPIVHPGDSAPPSSPTARR